MSPEDVAILTPTERSALFELLAADKKDGAVRTVAIMKVAAVTTMVGALSSHPIPAVPPIISAVVATLLERVGRRSQSNSRFLGAFRT
jgi:hypothetical protein